MAGFRELYLDTNVHNVSERCRQPLPRLERQVPALVH